MLKQSHMGEFSWNSVCDKLDDALKPVVRYKKTFLFFVGIFVFIFIYVLFSFVTTRSMRSFFIGGAVCVVGVCIVWIDSVYTKNQVNSGMRAVCEKASASYPGVSFYVRHGRNRIHRKNENVATLDYIEGVYKSLTCCIIKFRLISNQINLYPSAVSVSSNVGPVAQENIAPSAPFNPAFLVEPVSASEGEKAPGKEMKLDQIRDYVTGTHEHVAHPAVLVEAVSAIESMKTPVERMEDLDKLRKYLTVQEYEGKKAEILSSV